MRISASLGVPATIASLLLVGFASWGLADEPDRAASGRLPGNRELKNIFNSDIDGLLGCCSGSDTSPEEYKQLVLGMLDMGMHVLAQNVGMPDPVIYRSEVATTWDKYLGQSGDALAMRALLDAGTDPLTLTIEACRERGIPIVASYRMNAEDFYAKTVELSDFGRSHRDLKIPGAHCLDPAHPEVFKHRMEIFSEVANNYDIDGIEFDFKRWYHMVSDPHKNHVVLTRMVAETRKMLDEVARKKGRERLLLGVRVEPTLEGAFRKADLPGAHKGPPVNQSCADAGLDVKTWIKEGYVDYVCPSLFWPRLPGLPRTAEFVELARKADVGIYPTVFPLPAWAEDQKNPVSDSPQTRRRHRDEILRAALACYEQGADGISTFNWSRRDPDKPVKENSFKSDLYGRANAGYVRVVRAICPKLGNPQSLRRYLKEQAPTSDE